MMRSFLSVAVSLVLGALVPGVEAGLRGSVQKDSFLPDLTHALVSNTTVPETVEQRVADHMNIMRPVFEAVPRNKDGFLDASTVRYLLHRYFMDQRGWFVPASGRSEAADERLSEQVLGLGVLATEFRNRLAHRGLSLFEVAALAASLESLASVETAERLRAAYRLAGLSPETSHVDEVGVKLLFRYNLPMYAMR